MRLLNSLPYSVDMRRLLLCLNSLTAFRMDCWISLFAFKLYIVHVMISLGRGE